NDFNEETYYYDNDNALSSEDNKTTKNIYKVSNLVKPIIEQRYLVEETNSNVKNYVDHSIIDNLSEI
ncbi:6253_t:CDS:1, partial [Dentiscutata erythropus]